ncbi:unnamed protein product [Ostreobium quekettii]|uniref:Uncharacterized protein n=1 Tax=Ostreobium quekettii TaxID=121088 RepID=A0A8S1JE48_9CHLO|nr:unnamed protein product [Ostreobium quekettii]|eukprot:evm.model.scf_144.3 EVM.evm.TU.scf_144.3   scf_144:19590-21099(+)
MLSLHRLNLRLQPQLVRSLAGAAGLCVGDALGQMASLGRVDGRRVARVGVYGLMFHAHACHLFYSAMDKLIFPGSPASPLCVATKLLLDQAVFSPTMCAAYYTAMKTLEGAPWEAPAALRQNLMPTVTAAWAFWVPAQTVNFRLVTPENRVLVSLGLSVLWNALLSTIATANERPLADSLGHIKTATAAGRTTNALMARTASFAAA